MDINNISGVRVRDLKNGTGEQVEQARVAGANLENWAKDNKNVKQFIGPNGGWTRQEDGTFKPISDPVTLYGHRHHYHIGT